MANIFDYVQWRGELDITQAKFNEIDNLILSRVAYFPFDNILKQDEEITIKEAYERFKQFDIRKMEILQKEDIDLFPALAKSKRFGQLILAKYVNKIDDEEEKQFSAVTIILPDKTIYVSYRGTDNTIVGWKEDFNMSFKDIVYSQLDSVEYLENVANKYKMKIRVGGHSKGGNLAIYASAFCKPIIKKRIIEIYNNDGPGFDERLTCKKEYSQVLEKIHTFVPQSSIIGRLLNHEEKYTVVKSTQVGIMQHDLYTWQLMGPQFLYVDEVTDGSKIIDKTLKDWLIKVTPEQREQFVDIVYSVISSTKAKTLTELTTKWFENTKIVLKSYQNMDKKSKLIITQSLGALFNIAKDNMKKRN